MSNLKITNAKSSQIKTDLIIGWVFSFIFVIIWAVLFVEYMFGNLVGSGIISAFYNSNSSETSFLLGSLTVGIFFLIWMVLSLFVMRRIGKMYKAAVNGDVVVLKQINSFAWTLIALIFAGVIPGIMLLLTQGPINEMTMTMTADSSGPETEVIEKLSKLKSLLDSGIITKGEFDAKKNTLLHPESNAEVANSVEAQLAKLKTLFDSGAITQTEYDQQRQTILTKL